MMMTILKKCIWSSFHVTIYLSNVFLTHDTSIENVRDIVEKVGIVNKQKLSNVLSRRD